MRAAFIILTVLLLLCLLPLIVALGAGGLSGPLGCDYIAAEFRNCTLLGGDVSDVLTTAVALHWLGLLTLPFAVVIAGLLALLGGLQLIRRLRR